jgi:hypothetical protein
MVAVIESFGSGRATLTHGILYATVKNARYTSLKTLQRHCRDSEGFKHTRQARLTQQDRARRGSFCST